MIPQLEQKTVGVWEVRVEMMDGGGEMLDGHPVDSRYQWGVL